MSPLVSISFFLVNFFEIQFTYHKIHPFKFTVIFSNWLCNHHQYPVLKHFCHFNKVPLPIVVNPHSYLQPQAAVNLCYIPTDLPFLGITITGIIPWEIFGIFFLLSIIVCRLIIFWHVSLILFFLFVNSRSVFQLMDILQFAIHFPVDGHLDCFPFLVITNNSAMNIHVQAFMWTYGFISLLYT